MQYFYSWWLLRIPVLLLFPVLLYDFEIIFLIFPFLFLHLTLGLKSILNDYLHNKNSKTFLLLLVRICSFEFVRYVLEFLI
uniref:Succinate:cytochrome c oxidoreductase subunit 4 n=1 Tax=Calliarthron tuberculosum TaxID=48942 RepID=A0A0F7C9Q9_CALTB|nr:succinate:cytochrome c oxidoreductase subunit 4 [Calliarthron tuberculosum]AKG26268.1 succinate:cytochrome c oxidoreductase subunit 4 [Calliarthron tuberculosum]